MYQRLDAQLHALLVKGDAKRLIKLNSKTLKDTRILYRRDLNILRDKFSEVF